MNICKIIAAAFIVSASADGRYVEHVDPLISSDSSRWFFFGAAIHPEGMVNPCPDTADTGYAYKHLDVRRFSALHFFCVVGPSFMPTTGGVDPRGGWEAWKSPHAHNKEIAEVGYHKVHLERYGMDVETTATERTPFFRLTTDRDTEADLFINLYEDKDNGEAGWKGGALRRVSDTEVEGWVRVFRGSGPDKPPVIDAKVFFVMRFDHPVKSFKGWKDGEMLGAINEIEGEKVGGIVTLDMKKGAPVQMKMGVSYCSIKNARENMEAELPHWDMAKVRQQTRDVWEQRLSKVDVEGGTAAQRTKFHTDLFHSLLGRGKVDDVNGEYPDYSNLSLVVRKMSAAERLSGLHLYNHDSFWWSHMNLNILWGMVWPDVLESYNRAHMANYNDDPLKRLPRCMVAGKRDWTMTGQQAVPMLAAGIALDFKKPEPAKALEAMVDVSKRLRDDYPECGWGGIENQWGEYMKYGYVPAEADGFASASKTLEHAYTDWCIAQSATKLGRNDIRDEFLKRAKGWQQLYDARVGYIRPRRRDGTWFAPYDYLLSGNKHFCEANAAQYTWFCSHDVQGLANLMGGNQAYVDKLDWHFRMSEPVNFVDEYVSKRLVSYSNQADLHIGHLFNYAGAPWLSQKWIRRAKELAFGSVTTSNAGYCYNDEDQGQLGSLSALMAMGLYSARGLVGNPPTLELTSPVFDRVTIRLDPDYYSGKTFTIVAKNNSDKNMYIQSAKLNGRPWEMCWFPFDVFTSGGTLELELGAEPNKAWGVKNLPPSQSPVAPGAERNLTGAECEGSPPLDTYNYVIGTQTIGASYQFTKEPKLIETARAILAMGSNTLKFSLEPQIDVTPKPSTLAEAAGRDPAVRAVFELPFANYVMWVSPLSAPAGGPFAAKRLDAERREMYELVKYLLRTYSGTGKTFYLGNWEGDWLLTNTNPSYVPTTEEVQDMITWVNTRQKAVDDARRETPHANVQVYYYLEVNRVRDAMAGKVRVANKVLPQTNPDFVSYSSYDSQSGDIEKRYTESLDYLQSQLKPKPGIPGKRVFIGEYGMPLLGNTAQAQAQLTQHVIRAGLGWGCPFILYWEMYNNEVTPEGRQKGFWLIDDQGIKQPVYFTHQKFLEQARAYVKKFTMKNGRVPSREEFGQAALPWVAVETAPSRP